MPAECVACYGEFDEENVRFHGSMTGILVLVNILIRF
jgi:hypothetical protein